jgi:thioesterase domain-containing protein
MGYSAGGWYAYAVAEALLKRGAPLGLTAILDSHINTKIHRRIGTQIILTKLRERLPRYLRATLPPAKTNFWRGAINKLRALNIKSAKYLGLRLPGPQSLKRMATGKEPQILDAFVQLLTSYKPPRLPVKIELFAPKQNVTELMRVWEFYAKGGVHCSILFEDHHDYYNPDCAAALALALEEKLQQSDDGPAMSPPLTSP